MEGISRKADGRRIFSVEFKRQAVSRIVSGEKTLAELSREMEVQPGGVAGPYDAPVSAATRWVTP